MTIGSQTLRFLEPCVLQSRILQTLRLINSLIFAVLRLTVTDSATARPYAGTLPHSALVSLVKALYHVTSRLSKLWRTFYCAPRASLSYIVSLSSNSIIYPPIWFRVCEGLPGVYSTIWCLCYKTNKLEKRKEKRATGRAK
jgi:hypothetical protein